jgi:nicotinamidase-related amidase
MSKALLIIDVQNDYFADGSFPRWQAEAVAERTVAAIGAAQKADIPVVLIQHIAEPSPGPFFNPDTPGAAIHAAVADAAGDAPVVVKHFADSFEGTTLGATLAELGATELLLAGMMTQNCVTHTALSKAAEAYDVSVLVDLTTTVDEMLHQIALHALSTRVSLVPSDAVLRP